MTDWRTRGACYGSFDSSFFPAKGGNNNMAKAKSICGTCPVTAECLDYAMKASARYGIWGGLGEKARRDAKRRRLAA